MKSVGDTYVELPSTKKMSESELAAASSQENSLVDAIKRQTPEEKFVGYKDDVSFDTATFTATDDGWVTF